MAYFGGGVSAKPWRRGDVRFMAIFALSFCGIVTSLILAKDLPIFKSAPPQLPSNYRAQEPTPKVVTVPMLVAIKEVPAGSALVPSLFRLETRSSEGLEQQTIGDPQMLMGRTARLHIAANTPLIQAALSAPSSVTDITSRIPVGHRAVAIPVNALTGVEGWVRPGAFVDVVWSTGQRDQVVVSTIVENAKVLSVERNLEPAAPTKFDVAPPPVPSHITLLVSTAEAQRIQLAKASGSLNLSLRGADDGFSVGSSIITSEALLTQRDARKSFKEKVTVNGEEYVFVNGTLVSLKEIESENKARDYRQH